MRRKDREVKDFGGIMEIIDDCDIIRIGLADGDFPYIVPVNFAYTEEAGQVCFYIHGAMAGRKFELLTKNKKCSFEMDRALEIELMPEARDVTQRYKCVMGTADVELLTGEERRRAVDDIIMQRYEALRDFEYNRAAVEHTAVFKLTVREMSGKYNRPKGSADI